MKEELLRPSTSKMKLVSKCTSLGEHKGIRVKIASVAPTSYLSSSSSSSYQILPSRLVNIVVITISRGRFLRFFHKPSSSICLHFFSIVQQCRTLFLNISFASYRLIMLHCFLISKQFVIRQTDNSRKQIIFTETSAISCWFHSVPINKHCQKETIVETVKYSEISLHKTCFPWPARPSISRRKQTHREGHTLEHDNLITIPSEVQATKWY